MNPPDQLEQRVTLRRGWEDIPQLEEKASYRGVPRGVKPQGLPVPRLHGGADGPSSKAFPVRIVARMWGFNRTLRGNGGRCPAGDGSSSLQESLACHPLPPLPLPRERLPVTWSSGKADVGPMCFAWSSAVRS